MAHGIRILIIIPLGIVLFMLISYEFIYIMGTSMVRISAFESAEIEN